jgi:nickel-dependent lactate racemase
MARIVRIPFDDTVVELRVPASWQVLEELAPNPLQALHDVPAALRDALEHPIGCAPLSAGEVAGKKIAVAVDDITRPTPLHRFFPVVVEHLLARGARRQDILVINALGIHRPMTADEVHRKLGENNLDGLRWVNHDAKDWSGLVRLGTTTRGTDVVLSRHLADADLILCVGAIEPHLLLGFGGGLKMIVPGLAHEKTIAQNHMQGVTSSRFNYVGATTSPMRLDLEEAAQMLGKRIFIVNAVLNEKLEPARFVCGDPVAAHRQGVETVRSINARQVARRVDVAIVSSSPMDADLRQGMKCIGNVEQCVKDNGLIIGLLACRNGIGDVAMPPRALPHWVLRKLLRLLGKERILWFVDKVKRGAGVEERFMAHFSMQVVRKNEIYVWSRKLPPDTGTRLGLFVQFEDLQAMIDRAEKYAPRHATVYVLPRGGVTYPVLDG